MKLTHTAEPGASRPPQRADQKPANRRTPEDELVRDYDLELKDWANRLSRGDKHLRDDLYQEGAIGLVHAARRYDVSQGFKFSTLARRHITGRMKNYVRAQNADRQCVPMPEACYLADDHDDDNLPQDDCLPITAAEAIDQTSQMLSQVDLRLLQRAIPSALDTFTRRQRQIFIMRYTQGLAPSEIAHTLGVSPARVTQVLTEAFPKVRVSFLKA